MKDWNALASALYDGSFRPMFINGKWCPAQSGAEMDARNPANGSLLATVPQGGAADIDAAVKAARAAFEGPWAKFTPFERQALLLRIADKFEAEWERLCLSDTLDMGMPIQRTLANSRRVLGMLRFYAGQAVALHGDVIENSVSQSMFSFTTREPVGVVGAIIPWNAPTAASIWKIAPALAAGCTVVHKPAELSPVTARILMEIAAEAGLPPGVWNLVNGLGEEAGRALHHDGVLAPLVRRLAHKLLHDVEPRQHARRPGGYAGGADLERRGEEALERAVVVLLKVHQHRALREHAERDRRQ